MRNLTLGAVGVGLTVFLTAVASIPGATASPSASAVVAGPAHSQASSSATRTCYTQRDHDAWGYIISSQWEPMFDIYDSQAADDFVLTRPCTHPVIYVDGTYGEGTGSADSFNVTLYRAKNGGPGEIVRQFYNLDYTDFCGEGWGCIELALGKTLRPGHWWVSMQANIDYEETGSSWGWWTNLTRQNGEARWQNPQDGFETGCTTYKDLVTCLGEDSGEGPDLSFAITSS